MQLFSTRQCSRFIPFVALVFISVFFISCSKESTTDEETMGNWIRRSEFEGVGRTDAVSFIINNKLYVGGGYDGSKRLNDFWRYEQNTGTWIRVADFPAKARSGAVAFVLGDKGYVGTGYDDDGNRLKDFYAYDAVSDSWSAIADFGGTARYGAVAFALSNQGYVVSGNDGNFLKDTWVYDASANEWTQGVSFYGSKRSDASVFIYNNEAFVLGGINNGTYLNDFYAFSPATNTWRELRKISSVSDDDYDDDYGDLIRRANGMSFVLGDKAYYTMGTRSGILASTWEYDFSTDLWVEKTSFEGSAREGGIGFSLDGRGYILTGNNSSYRFDDMWEFFPGDEQSDDDN